MFTNEYDLLYHAIFHKDLLVSETIIFIKNVTSLGIYRVESDQGFIINKTNN